MNEAAPAELWIGRGDDKLGPHSLAAFRALHAAGQLQADDLIWWDGREAWMPCREALQALGLAAAATLPPELPHRPAATAPRAGTNESARNAMLGFVGLIALAAVAAGVFQFALAPAFTTTAGGDGDAVAVAEALNAASTYKLAYAEYVLINDRIPQTLADLGLESPIRAGLNVVHIQDGTLVFDTTAGRLALQPFRNGQSQIQFRCAYAPAPAGMQALGSAASDQFTTIAMGTLPDDCR